MMIFRQNKQIMKRMRQSLGLLLGCSLLTILLMTRSAAASTGANGAQWTVDFDFRNGRLQASLFVEVGIVVNGKLTDIQSRTEPLRCHPVGTIMPRPSGLMLSGSGYVTCYMPDIAPIVSDMTAGQFRLKPSCEATDAWVTGDVWLNPQVTSETYTTLFYHPELELRSLVLPTNGKASLAWRVDNGEARSSNFPLTDFEAFRAWIELSGFQQGYQSGFDVNGDVLASYGHNLANPLEISTGAATIYVGHSPTGTNFQGIIAQLTVDPPCIGGDI